MTLAKYIRLSDADEAQKSGAKDESDSVVNQRGLLDDYISSHAEFDGYRVLEFLDDGHSGTNFDRPGIRALLDAAKLGEVHCVLVKDFSRFGRTALEVSEYLELVFPFMGIRFIAVNNHYDSKTEVYGTAGNIDVGIQSIINENYSCELSEKVKAAKRQYAQRGQYISAYPFYGYVKAATDRRKLIPDPPAAAVVRRVFALCADGQTTKAIAHILNKEGAPTPTQRKRELGAKRKTWNSEREQNEWSDNTILRLLRDERYTGKLISGYKTRREIGKADSSESVDKKDWIVVPDAFEALVSQEEYAAAQAVLGHKTRRGTGTGKQHTLFYHKLKCGFCGLAPARMNTKRPYYKCDGDAMHSAGDCKTVRIFEEDLTKAVLSSIRFQAALAIKVEKRLVEQRRRARPAAAQAREKMERSTTQKGVAFVDYNAGRISKAEYNQRCQELNRQISVSQTVLTEMQGGQATSCQQQIRKVKDFYSIDTLDFETVDRLIERIRIFDGGRVEIVWKFADSYTALIEKYEGEPEK